MLAYYKEAPMFEESFASSKASRPGAHHGCWARLLMEDDRVVGVEYRSVPPSVDATDHCEEIFVPVFNKYYPISLRSRSSRGPIQRA